MPIAALPAIIGAAGSIGGAAIGASAAGNAANAQSKAAQQGIDTIQNNQTQTLQDINNIYGTSTANLNPYNQAGTSALNSLSSAFANPTFNSTGSLAATSPSEQWTQAFQAPTANQAAATPGYQFLQQAGQNAIQNSAAAQGNLLSGSTLKGLQSYSEGLASTNYQNAFNNALAGYNTNYNSFLGNRSNLQGGLQNLATGGQQAATTLGSLGSTQAGQIAGVNQGSAQALAQLLGQKGAATASGYVGPANAWIQGLGGATNALGQGLQLSQMSGSGYNPSTYQIGADNLAGISSPEGLNVAG